METQTNHRSQSYQSLPSPEQERAKRSSLPDCHDADTEESSSDCEQNFQQQPFKELQDANDKPPMSTKRRICLVASLLLCVFTVFAFAFILPCHHKTCLKETKWPTWSTNFTGVAPIVLRGVRSVDEGLSERIMVGFSHDGLGFNVLNHTCPGCHGGVLAIDGADGSQLWASGMVGKLTGNLVCDLSVKNDQPGCLALEDNNKIIRIDSLNGSQVWTTHTTGSIKSLMTIRDADGDGVGEIVLLYVPYLGGTSELRVLSGKTGQDIGQSLPVMSTRSVSDFEGFLRLHQLSPSKQLLLVGMRVHLQETGTLFLIEVDELLTRVQNQSSKATRWGPLVPNRYGFIEMFQDKFVVTPLLFADLNNDGVQEIVLCSLEAGVTVKAINGKDTSIIWTRKLTSTGVRRTLPNLVAIGDKATDIAILIQLDNKSTRIVVLNGENGLALWMFTLNSPLTVPPVGVPQRSNTPRGLLLWLPKVNVKKYIKKRGNIPNYVSKARTSRKKRSEYASKNDKVIDRLLDELIHEIDDDGDESHQHENNVRKIVHKSAILVDNSDNGADKADSMDHDHYDDDDDGKKKNDELKEYIINIENRLKRETKIKSPTLKKQNPTSHYSTITHNTNEQDIKPTAKQHMNTNTIPHTTHNTQTTERKVNSPARKIPQVTQQDKPLNCDVPRGQINKDISAVLVYRDEKQQLQLIELAREQAINIAPEDFVNKFGEQPPIAFSCVRLIPRITTRPIVADIDDNQRLDLVYAVDYVTENPTSQPARITHLMKLKKVDIIDAVNGKNNKKILTKLYRSDRKSYKRNEKFDSPFPMDSIR